MTQEHGSKIFEAVQLVMDYGFDGMEEAVRILLNEAMRLEREKVLNARPYERTEARQGYANGYKRQLSRKMCQRQAIHLSPWKMRENI